MFFEKNYSPEFVRNHHKDHCSEIIGTNNVEFASRIMEDIEVESDGEASYFNVRSSSSSDNEDEEVGGENDCRTSETEMS